MPPFWRFVDAGLDESAGNAGPDQGLDELPRMIGLAIKPLLVSGVYQYDLPVRTQAQ
jgi:hypothetical protein